MNLAVGVVQTPLRSREFPSMVFILENVSALLHVDRAGISESRQLRSLGFSFCQNKTYASQKWSNIGPILPLPPFMVSKQNSRMPRFEIEKFSLVHVH